MTNVVPVPVCDAIAVALPVEVIGPVRFALVVTVPAVSPDAVPVRLVAVPLLGVPSAPPLVTNAPAVPTLMASAVRTPVPGAVKLYAPAPVRAIKPVLANPVMLSSAVPLAELAAVPPCATGSGLVMP